MGTLVKHLAGACLEKVTGKLCDAPQGERFGRLGSLDRRDDRFLNSQSRLNIEYGHHTADECGGITRSIDGAEYQRRLNQTHERVRVVLRLSRPQREQLLVDVGDG